MNSKILSIVVPTYNMEKYLDRCLSSLVIDDEKMAQLEVIVVNDGSKDRSSEIAHGYEAKWPGTFKVIDKQNGNYGSCINAALPVAQGKYIKVLDADDWFSDNFQSFITFLSDADVDLVMSDFDFVLDDGRITKSITYNFPVGKDLPLSELLSCQEMWMHAVTYKTDNVRCSGYRQSEGISYTDQEWIFFPMKTVDTFAYFNKALYQYLQGREGQTIDMSVWLKHAKQEIYGAEVMLRQYCENKVFVPEDVLSYWENRIVQRSRFIYQRTLLAGLSFDVKSCGTDQYDESLRAGCPVVYNLFDSEVVSPKIQYRYISEWRNNHYHRPLRLKFIILLKQIRNMILAVTGK